MASDLDPDLLEALRSGDKKSFASLVIRHQEAALRIAWFHTSNWQDAEEAAQDAFVKVFHNIKKFKSQAKFSTWFYRILINQCHDLMRRRQSALKAAREIMSGVEAADLDSFSPSPDDPNRIAQNNELQQRIDAALRLLPPKQQSVFIFHYLEGKKLGEIADILGIREGSVKAHLFQAREKLKTLLKETDHER